MAYNMRIVDEEKMLTELLSSHLQDCGYMAFAAENAEQVIAVLNTYPDLILPDINMSESDFNSGWV